MTLLLEIIILSKSGIILISNFYDRLLGREGATVGIWA
jgi:hypothetical protein